MVIPRGLLLFGLVVVVFLAMVSPPEERLPTVVRSLAIVAASLLWTGYITHKGARGL